MTSCTSLEVRYRNTSPSGFVNQNNNNSGNNNQGTPTSGKFHSTIPRVNKMAQNDIKLSIFIGNWLEDPKQHWFLCEVVWTVRQV